MVWVGQCIFKIPITFTSTSRLVEIVEFRLRLGWLTLGLPRQANYKCSRMDKGSHYEGKAFIYSKQSISKGDTLPLSYIPSLAHHREIELTNPKAKGRESQRHYSWTTEQLGVGPSFRTITDTKIMGKIGFNCQLFLSEIGLTTDSSHSTWFQKTVRFSRSKLK